MQLSSWIRVRLLVVITALLGACATTAPGARLVTPTVTLQRIRTLYLDSNGLLAEAMLNVENPNPFPLRMDRVTYELSFEGRRTATGQTLEPIEIPARGRTLTPVKLRAPYRSVIAAGAVLLAMGEIPYELRMNAHFDTPLGTITVPLTHQGRLDLPSVVPGLGPSTPPTR